MATYRRTNLLSVTDAAYLAGIIDGQGTISLSRKHRTDNRQLAISVSSTERPILEYIQTACGVGKITGKRNYNSKHAPSYTYTVCNRQALSLLEQISQYLQRYKKRRCNMILTDYLTLTPRNGKYTPELAARRIDFEMRFLATKPTGR